MPSQKVLIALATLVIGSQGLFSALPAWAQTAPLTTNTKQATTASRLAVQYSDFAGSRQNADALIKGLRDGTSITLTASAESMAPAAPSAKFTPSTSKLGYGNINVALSLAKADLAKQGISNPTPAQLAAALNGGVISTAGGTVTLLGILAQRQAGSGWGTIANAMGVKLGSVVSAAKTNRPMVNDSRAFKSSPSENKSAKSSDSPAGSSNQGGSDSSRGGGGSGSGGRSNGGGNSGGNGGGGGGGGRGK